MAAPIADVRRTPPGEDVAALNHPSDSARSGFRAALDVWFARLRVIAAVAIVWAGLYFLLDRALLPVGSQRPATVLIGFGGPLPAAAMFVVVAAGAAVAGLLVPRRDPRTAMLVIGLALALWAAARGNIDDWLIASHPTAGPAGGAAYWPLIGEYAYFAVLLVAAACAVVLGRRSRPALPAESGGGLVGQLIGEHSAARREGPLALLVTAAGGAIGLVLLTGPIVSRTLRGQVYFAILIGFVFGVIAARQFCRHAGPAWFWAAPILVGVAGVVLAAVFPGRLLGAEYSQLNILPANGLVRPLPVELLGVGIVAICWGLHLAPGRDDAEPPSQ